jgi:hypothetical protein
MLHGRSAQDSAICTARPGHSTFGSPRRDRPELTVDCCRMGNASPGATGRATNHLRVGDVGHRPQKMPGEGALTRARVRRSRRRGCPGRHQSGRPADRHRRPRRRRPPAPRCAVRRRRRSQHRCHREGRVDTFGRLDMAFNNAGIQVPPSDAADEPAEVFDRSTAPLSAAWSASRAARPTTPPNTMSSALPAAPPWSTRRVVSGSTPSAPAPSPPLWSPT